MQSWIPRKRSKTRYSKIMATKQYDTPLEEVIGTVESVTFLSDGKKKDGSVWEKFRVMINGDEFETFEAAFENEIGKEGNYKFSRNTWTDKNGKSHVTKQLIRLQGVRRFSSQPTGHAPTPPILSQSDGKVMDEGKVIIAYLQRIEARLARMEDNMQGGGDTGIPGL